MQQSDIRSLLQTHFENVPGFDGAKADTISSLLATTTQQLLQQSGAAAVQNPTPTQQQCYSQCQITRDAALAEAALKGWPGGTIAAAAAIFAFNACRHQCDR